MPFKFLGWVADPGNPCQDEGKKMPFKVLWCFCELGGLAGWRGNKPFKFPSCFCFSRHVLSIVCWGIRSLPIWLVRF